MLTAFATQYFIIITSVMVAFIICFLGLFIYLDDRKNLINKIFFALVIFTAIWIATVIVGLLFKSYSLKTLSGRAGFASAAWIIFLIYHFFYHFPVKNNNFKERLAPFFVISLILSGLCLFTPLMIKVVEQTPSGIERNVYGAGYFLFIIYFLIYLGIAVYTIISKFSKLDSLQITQSKFILVGIAVSETLAFITNFLLPKITDSNYAVQFGPSTILFFIIVITYAILRHQTFNLKIITTELYTTIILMSIFIRFLTSKNLEDFLWNLLLIFIVIIFGVLLIQSILKEVKQKENLKLLAKSLESTNKKLEQIDTARREFLSFASHQLRAPMTVIKGYASLILDKNYLDSPEKTKPIVSKIINSMDQLNRLIKNFLDARAIEEGKMSYILESVDLVSLSEAIVDEFKPLATEKGLALSFETSKPLITVKADKTKLRQVIQNLVDNAIKYTASGFVKVSIQDKKESILFAVADSGKGISPETKERLFEQFVREKEATGEIRGTGLGLYIAKEIVNAHQGRIWAESEGENKGSVFYVELPIR